MAENEVTVWRARPKRGGAWCYDRDVEALAQTLADASNPGDAYDVECVSMPRLQFEQLGDFDGW